MVPPHPGVERILRGAGTGDLLSELAALPGSDRSTLLLEEAERRAAGTTAADVLRRYRSDRYVRPAQAPARELRRSADEAIGFVDPPFELVDLAPLVPLGAHAALGGVAQDRVLTTVRSSEVAADPTLGLALEAADRRSGHRPPEPVHLAAVQRVVRTDHSPNPLHLGHFTLLGLVTAGRDVGSRAFERDALVEHIAALGRIVAARVGGAVVVRLTDFDGSFGPLLDDVEAALASEPVAVDRWPDRRRGAGYYPGACFHVFTTWRGEQVGVADGGVVDWTQRLLHDRKERLVTSGVSLDRLLVLSGP